MDTAGRPIHADTDVVTLERGADTDVVTLERGADDRSVNVRTQEPGTAQHGSARSPVGMRPVVDLGMPIAMLIACVLAAVGVAVIVLSIASDGATTAIYTGLSLLVAGVAAMIVGWSALARRRHRY